MFSTTKSRYFCYTVSFCIVIFKNKWKSGRIWPKIWLNFITGSGSRSVFRIRIRIQPGDLNPEPQHCFLKIGVTFATFQSRISLWMGRSFQPAVRASSLGPISSWLAAASFLSLFIFFITACSATLISGIYVCRPHALAALQLALPPPPASCVKTELKN